MMHRYQFRPRAGHFLNFENARAAAEKFGATRIRVAFPMMSEASDNLRGTRIWRGTNQPKTLAFTLTDKRNAIRIEEEYGYHLAFVEFREEI